MKDVIIIGAGPVGLFGAFYAGLRGMSVTVVDSLEEPGGQLSALYPEKFIFDMPGFPEVYARDLANEMYKQAMRFSPEFALGEKSMHLERIENLWRLMTDKREHLARTVIICAGIGAFTPTKLGVEKEDEFLGKGLSYGVRNVESCRNMRCVIVGGGDSAMDWAVNLHGIASDIAVVHRRDQFRAHEETVAEAKKLGVKFRLWEVITELHGEMKLEAVKVQNTQTKDESFIPCDRVIVCIGYKSSLGPLKNWGLNLEKNKIIVDNHRMTNLPGVFAAGDVCTYDGKLDLIATGVGEVCVAVNYAKHMIDPSAKVFPGHSTDMELPPL